MSLIVIGVTGTMGSGKDTVGGMLVKELNSRNFRAKQFAFASALKDAAKKFFKWDGHKDGDVFISAGDKTSDKTSIRLGGRSVLQGLGVFAREEVGKNFWVQKLETAIYQWAAEVGDYPNVAVVTDLRFINEAEWIAKRPHQILRVVRPGFGGDNHISETEMQSEPFLKLVTHTFQNNGSLADAEALVRNHVIETLLRKEA